MSTDNKDRYVTNSELQDELRKLPSRWEVRFLILAGFIAANTVPGSDIASAAIKVIS